MASNFAYRLFGLRIRSELELPELPADANTGSDADVAIVLEPVAIGGSHRDGYFFDRGGAGFEIEGVGRFWIGQGRRISIDPAPGVPAGNIRLYLLGSAMGVALHQRGVLPLHANAVEINGRAFAFMGPSGIGKSTLASAFHDHGHRVIADDVTAIRFDGDGMAKVSPGIPRMRLWEEALAATGKSPGNLQRSYSGDDSYQKFDVPIDAYGTDVALGAIYRMVDGDELGLRLVTGAEAVEELFANTYRGGFLKAALEQSAHWMASLRLLEQVPLYELMRPRGLGHITNYLPDIVRHAASTGTGDESTPTESNAIATN